MLRKALLAAFLCTAISGVASARPALWSFGFDDRADEGGSLQERVYRRDCVMFMNMPAEEAKPTPTVARQEPPRIHFRLTLHGLPTGMDPDVDP
jgi:hypothetical protein